MKEKAASYRVVGRGALLAAAATLLLAGCAADEHQDLRAELGKLTAGVQGKVEPLPPVIDYKPFPYGVEQFPDPFSPQKAIAALRTTGGQNAPDMKRAREPLEAFPLEAMQVVGSLSRAGRVYAVVKTDRGLYRVTTGNYMGLNFGKITRVTEGEVELKELIEDGNGDWSEKTTVVPLTEASLPKK